MSWRTWADRAKQSGVLLRLADLLGRGRGRWRFLDHIHSPVVPPRPDMSHWDDAELSAVWIGHATVLLRLGGSTFLTDPVWSTSIGVGLGLITGGPWRQIAPALPLRGLPHIDAILLSHAHYDHLDRPTLSRLPKSIPVIAPASTSDLLRDLQFRSITELNWGEQTMVGRVRVTSQPTRHWGARSFYDRHRGFCGFVLEAEGRRVLFAGDTAFQHLFRDVAPVDLGIFCIGAYNPFIEAHANPEQVWEMVVDAQAAHVMAIHHSTFSLSHEPMGEPIERLVAAAGNDAARIVIRRVGQRWTQQRDAQGT